MTRRLASSFVLAAVLGCAPCPGGPATTARMPPAPASTSAAPGDGCYAAALLVTKDVATAAAVDPVETHMGILHSRAFFAGAPAALAPRAQVETERLGSSAIFTVRVRSEPARARATCEWVVAHALERPGPDYAAQWLGEQRKKLEQELAASEQALAQYDEQHDLRVLSGEDQVEALRKELTELSSSPPWRGKPGVDVRRKQLTDRALTLNLVLLERARLARSSESSAKLLELIVEQESKQQLAGLLDPPLRLLDACAACEGR